MGDQAIVRRRGRRAALSACSGLDHWRLSFDPFGARVLNTPLHLQLQRLIGDRFRLESELFGGGMSRVFVAHEPALGRRVVVKVLPPELVSAVSLERFQREIAVTAQLQHPHILPLVTAGEGDGLMWYVAPYIEERSLRERLEGGGPLPLADALRYLSEVTEAVAFAHARGIVHRDIKPGNVLLQQGHALLSDFGVAQALHEASPQPGITGVETHAALSAYLPPDKPSGERMDLWALGVLAHELTTGRLPNGEGIRAAVRSRGLKQPAVERALERFLERALASDAAERFQSATEMAAALGTVRAAATPTGGSRIAWMAGLLGLLAVVGYGADRYRASHRTEAPGERPIAIVAIGADPTLTTSLTTALWSATREWEDVVLAPANLVGEAVRPLASDVKADPARLAAAVNRASPAQVLIVRVQGSGASRSLVGQLFGSNERLIGEYGAIEFPEGAVPLAAARRMISLALRSTNEVPWAEDSVLTPRRLSVWRLYDRAHGYFRVGALSPAESLFRMVIDAEPGHQWARLRLAQTMLMRTDRVGVPVARRREAGDLLSAVRASKVRLRAEDSTRVALWSSLVEGESTTRGCDAFRAATQLTPEAWDVWFALGFCLYDDERVLPVAGAPGKMAFRSSRRAAQLAFERSLDALGEGDPTSVMHELRRILPLQPNVLRRGLDASGQMYFARFAWDGDSTVQRPELGMSMGVVDGLAVDAAVREHAKRLDALSRRWVKRDPRSAEAHELLANTLEVRGILLRPDSLGRSAVEEYAEARRLTTDRELWLSIVRQEVRTRLRGADFAGARRLSDSVLATMGAETDRYASQLLGYAALRGDLPLLERLSIQVIGDPSRSQVDRTGRPLLLPAVVSVERARVRARAILGVCDDELRAAPQRLRRLLRVHVPDSTIAEPAAVTMLDELHRLAPSCLGYPAMSPFQPMGVYSDLLRLMGAGRADSVRRVLLAQDERARVRPGRAPLDFAVGYAELWLALGDSARAQEALEVMLDGLPNAPLEMLSREEQAGALRRGLALVTRLAAARGAREPERRWGAALRALDGDPGERGGNAQGTR